MELTNLVQKVSDPLVINLDAQWGEGKSTFVKMWQAHLKQAGYREDLLEGYESIYIDAFTHDYMDDPFVAVVTSVYSQVRNKFPNQQPLIIEAESFKEKAISAGKQIVAFGGGLAAKVMTHGALDGSDFENVASEVSKQSGSAVEKYLKTRFENSSEKEAIDKFRVQLRELGAAVQKAQGFPLVIIIDELDRCRPIFAIEMLEKIKHLFSVENVTFLLVTNNDQLECSIKSVYGESINAGLYLQKFITLSFYLPKANFKDKASLNMDFCRQLVIDHNFDSTISNASNIATQMCAIADFYGLSLRQIEKAMQRLALLFSVADYDSRELAVLMSAWSVIDSNFLHNVLANKVTLKDLVKQYGLTPVMEEMKEKKNIHSKKRALFAGVGWFIYAYGSDKDREEYDEEITKYANGDGMYDSPISHDPRQEALELAERLVGYTA